MSYNNKLTPIVLFVYNRPFTTEKTLITLSKNSLASQTELWIFSDGAKNEKELPQILEVRNVIKKYYSRFKDVKVFESNTNKGLRESIISGVNQVFKFYDKAIVLEDDLITSPYFLEYMNHLLNLYETNTSVYSISGFSPIEVNLPDYPYDIFASYRFSSWGWGTWKKVWEKIDWRQEKIKEWLDNTHILKEASIKLGEDIPGMLLNQYLKKIDSWAIQFTMYTFENEGITILPAKSMVKHIGYQKGTHHKAKHKKNEFSFFPDFKPARFPNIPQYNPQLIEQYRQVYLLSLPRKLKYKILFRLYYNFPSLLSL